MASFEKYYPRLKKWEGGYAVLAGDSGGCTNHGIAYNYNKHLIKDYNQDGKVDCEDVRLMPLEDAKRITKTQYWDKFLADRIRTQEIAEMLVDWGYNAGLATPTRELQKILGLPADGVFGENTLKAVNSANQKKLYEDLFKAREQFYRRLGVSMPQFLQGWLNRLNDFPKTISTRQKVGIVLIVAIILGAVFVYLYRKEIINFYKNSFQKIRNASS
ncbi:MAG: glycoside hydrolase family 108 protein [Raineya sp.]